MKSLIASLIAVFSLVSMAAHAADCRAESMEGGADVRNIQITTTSADIQVWEVGGFMKNYFFEFQPKEANATRIHFAGQNISMIYDSVTRLYEIEAVLCKSPELMPGKLVKLHKVSCEP